MLQKTVTFNSVKRRMKMLDIDYMPYASGGGYFVASRPVDRNNDFPYATGPRCLTGAYRDDQIIPEAVVLNWFHRLTMTPSEIDSFWSIVDLEPPQQTAP